MTESLHAENLLSQSRIRHAFFTRDYGNGGFSQQENSANIDLDRARMAVFMKVAPQNLLLCEQTHSTDVVTVTDIWDAGHRPRADAMATDKTGVALGVLTADCVPVLFAHARAGIIGAAHAGWRGALGGVIENTLAAMENLGAVRGGIVAALGPCIWQASYDVGAEFPAPFIAESGDNARFFQPALKSGHYRFDLPGYVAQKLRDLGVGSVAASLADTCSDPVRFFSHRYSTLRGEKRGGNLMSAIVLEDILRD